MWYMFLQVWDVFASHIYICIKFQVITRQLQQIEESYPLYQHPLYLDLIVTFMNDKYLDLIVTFMNGTYLDLIVTFMNNKYLYLIL